MTSQDNFQTNLQQLLQSAGSVLLVPDNSVGHAPTRSACTRRRRPRRYNSSDGPFPGLSLAVDAINVSPSRRTRRGGRRPEKQTQSKNRWEASPPGRRDTPPSLRCMASYLSQPEIPVMKPVRRPSITRTTAPSTDKAPVKVMSLNDAMRLGRTIPLQAIDNNSAHSHISDLLSQLDLSGDDGSLAPFHDSESQSLFSIRV